MSGNVDDIARWEAGLEWSDVREALVYTIARERDCTIVEAMRVAVETERQAGVSWPVEPEACVTALRAAITDNGIYREQLVSETMQQDLDDFDEYGFDGFGASDRY